MTPEQIKKLRLESFKRVIDGDDHGMEARPLDGNMRLDKSPARSWQPLPSNEEGMAVSDWDYNVFEYRIRPDTVNVFGMELPAGEHVSCTAYASTQEDAQILQNFFDDCLSGKYAAPKLPEPFREHPEIGKKYCFINSDGEVLSRTWLDNTYCINDFELGNCYRTESDAQQWSEHLTAIRKGGPRTPILETIDTMKEVAKGLQEIRSEYQLGDLPPVAGVDMAKGPDQTSVVEVNITKPQKPQIDRDSIINILKWKFNTHKVAVDTIDTRWAEAADAIIENLKAEPVTQAPEDLKRREVTPMSKLQIDRHKFIQWLMVTDVDNMDSAELADAIIERLNAEPVTKEVHEIDCGVSRAEWHDKAWELFHAKTFENTQLHKVNMLTIREVFNATYDALPPAKNQEVKELSMPDFSNGFEATYPQSFEEAVIEAFVKHNTDLLKERGLLPPKDLR